MNAAKLAASVLFGTLLWLAGCGKSAPLTLGEAYVASASLNLRAGIGQRTGPATPLKFGDHLRIVDVRRRFVKVLTDQGQEGWLDSVQLLSPAEMEEFRKFNTQSLRLTSQGAATVYTELNVHIEPNRQSPALTRIPEGGSVEVLAHKLLPKTTGSAPPPNATSLITKPPPARKVRRERASAALSLRPPKPPPPKVPENWAALSAEKIEAEPAPEKTPASPPPPLPPPPSSSAANSKTHAKNAKGNGHSPSGASAVTGEDWSLVRTKDHLCGWVLTRNLILSIPDEVAQYAEGKRIAAYFDLGIVKDENGVYHDWLWAIASDLEAYDFDSIRVFIWDKRRHRYETAYRDRGLEGYFPIRVDASEGKPRFSVIVRAADGQFLLRRYLFDGVRVHLVSKDPYQLPSGAGQNPTKAAPLQVVEMQSRIPQPGWWRRHWDSFKRMLRR